MTDPRKRKPFSKLRTPLNDYAPLSQGGIRVEFVNNPDGPQDAVSHVRSLKLFKATCAIVYVALTAYATCAAVVEGARDEGA